MSCVAIREGARTSSWPESEFVAIKKLELISLGWVNQARLICLVIDRLQRSFISREAY